ncbi:MAG: amino acid adenylation domain-containing protein [Burkholderiaceae bacterium]
MSARDLVTQLSSLGVKIVAEEGQLRIRAPKGVLTAEIRESLAQHKSELIRLLSSSKGLEPIQPVERIGPLPVSMTQERFLFLSQMYPEGVAYNLPNLHRLDGELDERAFESAIAQVVARHEALRTVFGMQDDQMVQMIVDEPNHLFEAVDATDETDPMAFGKALAVTEANRPFDLMTGPLLRVQLIKLERDQHLFCWNLHHIVSDGWSSMIFVRELKAAYESQLSQEALALEPVLLQYADFGAWERNQLDQGMFSDQLDYWKSQLTDPPPVLRLPADRMRPPILSYRGNSLDFSIPPDLVGQLKGLARDQGVTLFTVLLAGYAILLNRYSQQEDVCIGSPIARRNRPEIEDVYGCFINPLAIRARMDGDPSVSDLIAQVRSTCIEAFANQDIPFERIVEEINPERNTGVTPVFQAMFIFHVQDTRKIDEIGSVKLTPLDIHANAAKFDVTLEVTEIDSGARGFIEYSTDLFDELTISRLSQHYLNLLQSLVADPSVRVSELSLLSQAERSTLLEGRNVTHASYPLDKTFADLFSERAGQCADQIAVQGPDERTMTYGQLEEKSNRLAHYLVAQGVTQASLVGVYLDRSVEMLCALLAVMKSGAAYVPLDPMFPPDRLSYMAEDAQLELVLTQQSLADTTPGAGSRAVMLDAIDAQLAVQPSDSIVLQSRPQRAYVIYTSGSTGRPKGVEVGHRALTNFLCSMVREPGLASSDCLLAVTTLSFDIAALELYAPLLVGARTVLASREQSLDPQRLAARLVETDATVMQATPATWRMLIDSGWAGDPNLKVLCGGEALPRELANALLGKCAVLWNMYGPTETTIWSTVQRLEPGEGVVPVGRPIANTQIYVLDEALNLVPDGVQGELYIAGDGVAQGYLNRAELTDERFVANPFGSSERMYRTGDRARWRAVGVLEVLGRLDDQVKLRGYRIEPGEIRALLVQDEQISDAVVVVREDVLGSAQLVAYLISATGSEPEVARLRAMLKELLPEYMVPSAWVSLQELPLTPNGKVDKQALPAPDAQSRGAAAEQVAPQNETQEQIARVWARLLGVDSVGVTDGFFELGGHSLLAVRLVTELENELGIKVPLMKLFQGATVEQIARINHEHAMPEAGACYPLRQGGHLTPLFLVGSNPRYRNAVSKVDSRRPVYQLDVYGLQAARLQSSWKPYFSIEQIAGEMLGEIKRIQPNGPYEIAGGCEGSLVALELALRLQQAGEIVNQLIVWITPAPGEPLTAVFNKSTARRLWYQFQSLRLKGSIRELGLRGQWRLVQHELVEYMLFAAMLKYRPHEKFDGMIHVARVPFGNDYLVKDQSLGWSELASNGAQATQMPGDHDTWLKEHADVFGEFLEACLTETTEVHSTIEST